MEFTFLSIVLFAFVCLVSRLAEGAFKPFVLSCFLFPFARCLLHKCSHHYSYKTNSSSQWFPSLNDCNHTRIYWISLQHLAMKTLGENSSVENYESVLSDMIFYDFYISWIQKKSWGWCRGSVMSSENSNFLKFIRRGGGTVLLHWPKVPSNRTVSIRFLLFLFFQLPYTFFYKECFIKIEPETLIIIKLNKVEQWSYHLKYTDLQSWILLVLLFFILSRLSKR